MLLVMLFAAILLFLPWKSFLETRVSLMLQAKGFQNISFHIDKIGLRALTLSNVTLGKENPLVMPSITLDYSIREVVDGALQNIHLSGLHIRAIETDKGWVFTGMDVLPKYQGEKIPTDIPAFLKKLPFDMLTITASDLQIVGKSIQGDIPFTLSLGKKIDFETIETSVVVGANKIGLGKAMLTMAPVNDVWKGTWNLFSVTFGEDVPVPPIKGEGTVSLEKSQIAVTGSILSSDKKYNAAAEAYFDVDQLNASKITLISAIFPFKQGTVSTKNVIVKLPMNVPLTIKKVSVGDLLQSVTGDKVSATGTFSGNVPLTITGNGEYYLGQGSLKADSIGLIRMPGELIPGDNEQVELVRKILENLHYSLLSAGIQSGKEGKMTVSLSLQGNNPDVYNGRPVKLNLNLTGDLLDIIQQNIMLFGNPEKLIEQGSHE